jgi:hypothetical protein
MVSVPDSHGQDRASQAMNTMAQTLASGQRAGLSGEVLSGAGISLA